MNASSTIQASGAHLIAPPSKKNITGANVALAAILVAAGAFLPLALSDTFYLTLLVNGVVLGIAALAIGFLAHQCGLIMFGAAGFAGGSSYLFAIAVNQFGWQLMAASAFAVAAATGLSFLVGMLVVRTRPLPFAMMTLALAQMLKEVVSITEARPVTGGDDGLNLSFTGTFFGLTQAELSSPVTFWPVAWLALCGVLCVAWAVDRSRTGTVLRMIKANEERMRFSGFDTYWPRVWAFSLAGLMAAISGLLVGLNAAFVSPELLDFATGGMALVSMLIGGASTVLGPVVGALLYVIGQDQFGTSGHLELLTGVAVVVVIMGFPDGVFGTIRKTLIRTRRREQDQKGEHAAR